MGVKRTEYKGHLLFEGGTDVSPSNQGVYCYGMTVMGSTNPGVTVTRYRAGVIVPRPGSTYGEVKGVVYELSSEGLQGAVVTHWDFAPNVVFGSRNDVACMPDEVAEQDLRARVAEDGFASN